MQEAGRSPPRLQELWDSVAHAGGSGGMARGLLSPEGGRAVVLLEGPLVEPRAFRPLVNLPAPDRVAA